MSKVRSALLSFKKIVKQPLFTNILIVGCTTLAVKAVGFYKELVIAENLGLSELLDTFLIAMLVPSFISTVFLNSYSNVFIPNYVIQMKEKGNLKAFQTTSILITLSISLIFIIIAYLSMPSLDVMNLACLISATTSSQPRAGHSGK